MYLGACAERAIPGTDYLPPSVNKALRKLLTSCGIPGDSFADDMDEGDVAAGVLQPLTSFLQAAAEVCWPGIKNTHS